MFIGSQGYGLVNELERAGFDVGVHETWRVPVTPQRVFPAGHLRRRGAARVGPLHRRVRVSATATSRWSTPTSAPSTSAHGSSSCASGVIARLTELDRADLVDEVDVNLFGASLDPDLPGDVDRRHERDAAARQSRWRSSWPRPEQHVAEPRCSVAHTDAGVAATSRNVLLTRSTMSSVARRPRRRSPASARSGPRSTSTGSSAWATTSEGVVMVARHAPTPRSRRRRRADPRRSTSSAPDARSSAAAAINAVDAASSSPATQPIAATPRTRRRRRAGPRCARTGGGGSARRHRPAGCSPILAHHHLVARTGTRCRARADASSPPSCRARTRGGCRRRRRPARRDRSATGRRTCARSVSAAARSAVGPRSWA